MSANVRSTATDGSSGRRRRTWAMVAAVLLATTLAGASLSACQPADPPPPPSAGATALGTFEARSSAADYTTEARTLGVHYVRTSQGVKDPGIRPKVTDLSKAGFKVVIHYTNGPGPVPPITTDAELATYKKQLDAKLAAAPPALAAIENEENWNGFYSGDPVSYVRQLRAAVDVAHKRHVLITDGGLIGTGVALCTWQHYRDTGQQAKADDYARRVFADPRYKWLRDALLAKPFNGLHRATTQEVWDETTALIKAFKTVPMDYVNFHWYLDDAKGLGETVDYLRQATGKQIVTTEIGSWSTDASIVSSQLPVLVSQRHLPFVLWWDTDGVADDGSDKARALHERPGVLRLNGEAFATFVAHHGRELR